MAREKTYCSPLDYVREGKRLGRGASAVYTPLELQQRAIDYFEFMRGKVWNRAEAVKGGMMAGMIYEVPTSCPLDLKGFLLFSGFGLRRWEVYKADEIYTDVCEWVEMIIETQNFEGAAVGAYNANLIARRHKIADKQETTLTTPPEQITGMQIKVDGTDI